MDYIVKRHVYLWFCVCTGETCPGGTQEQGTAGWDERRRRSPVLICPPITHLTKSETLPPYYPVPRRERVSYTYTHTPPRVPLPNLREKDKPQSAPTAHAYPIFPSQKKKKWKNEWNYCSLLLPKQECFCSIQNETSQSGYRFFFFFL